MEQVFKSDRESFFSDGAAAATIDDGFSEALGFGSSPCFQLPALESSDHNQTHSAEQKNLFEKLRKLPSLNLNLRISTSLMHQLGSILSQQNNITQQMSYVSQQMSEKRKATNFSASVLRIGTWERVSRHEGHLVAKCYPAKKKLVWEILEGSLKRKIEIQWAEILAIRAIIQENEPGVLEVELQQPPSFYHEIDPQPRKHTNWRPIADFTEGQASLWRRHYLKFPPGVLDRHFEKLLEFDNRLFELSQKPFPSLESPYFHSSFYGIQDFSLNFNPQRPQIYSNLDYHEQYFPAQQAQAYPPIQQSFSFKDSASPNSVMEFSNIAENLSMAFWGQAADNFAAAESIARNQVQGQLTNASTTPPAISYQDNNYNESGNMQHPLDAHQMQIESLKQILMTDSEIEYPDDDKSSLASIASFGALINQSMEGNLGINHVANYVHNTCTSLDMDFSAKEDSTDTTLGQLYPQPISRTPHQVTDDIPQPVSWIPRQYTDESFQIRNSSSSYPMRDDFSAVNSNNGVIGWP